MNKEYKTKEQKEATLIKGKGSLTFSGSNTTFTLGDVEIPVSTAEKIRLLTIEFSKFLQAKNLKYKDSALNPIKIFSKFKELGDTGLGFRMDDKISRFINSDVLRKNDVVDTVGYLMLICIHMGWMDLSDQID